MPFSEWDGTLVLDHAIIDQDHQVLSESVAAVVAAVEASADNPGVWRVAVASALGALREASVAHFRSEEWIMQMGGYTGIDAHRHQHRVLLDELAVFAGRDLVPGEETNRVTVAFFQEWFEFHIRVWDSALVRWLNGRTEKRSRKGDASES
jgi:hemerythrin-like metal-binding protein